MATGAVLLQELPAVAEQVAVGVVRASHALATAAIDHSRDATSPSRAQFLVSKAHLEWRMSLVKKEGRVFLFFFRSEGPPQTQLEATVRLVIEASDSFMGSVPSAEGLPVSVLRVVHPRFLEPSPSPEELERFAPGGTERDTTLIRLGAPDPAEMLAIISDGGEGARFHVTRPTGSGWLEPKQGRWPVAQFASAFEALRAWIAAGAPAMDETRSVVLKAQPHTDLGGIVRALSAAYAAVSLALEGGASSNNLPAWMTTRYTVSSYSAVVLLWLDDDGNLADAPDEAELSLAHYMTFRGRSSTVEGRISLAPADFLAVGPLLAGIAQTMSEAVTSSREELFGSAPPSAEELDAFFVGAPAMSLRVAREEDEERHVVLWRGMVGGRTHWLVAAGWLVIGGNDGDGWQVLLTDDSELEVQAFGPVGDDLFGLRNEAVELLVKFVNGLRSWEKLLS